MKKMKFYLIHLSKKLFFVLSILYLNSCNMDRFSNPKEEIETVFFSDDMGYSEFIKIIANEEGDSHYYSTDNISYEKMGLGNQDGTDYYYFYKNPKKHYYIFGVCCGFKIENPNGVIQGYHQLSPICEIVD